jgi:hypothetical protein
LKREATVELPSTVPFVDGAVEGWQERATVCLDEGYNFFVLVRKGVEEVIADIIDIPTASLPPVETKATLLSSSRFIDPKMFRLPEQRADNLEVVYHIEQLWLPRTRPPQVKQYLTYCYVRGIISQHDLPGDARVACDHYNNDRFSRSQYPEAAVYRWEHDEWRRTRLC